VNLRFALLALVQVFLSPYQLCAQLPPRLQRCLPYPTLAQEISEMQAETNPPEPASLPAREVVIASVQFAPGTHISGSVRNRVVWSIKSVRLVDDSKLVWLQELQEVGILGALQDSGYFRAKVKANAHLLEGNEKRRLYALILHIEEGQQYRLGDVRFKSPPDSSPLAFSESELRTHVPMKRGDIFNVSKMREAIRQITYLYAANGYIDMVPTPETENDDAGGRLDLILIIDQGKQYRIGTLEFLGLDQRSQHQLRPKLRQGQIFNPRLVDELLTANKSILPSDASQDDLTITRNTKDGVVNLSFDFYSCDQLAWTTPD